MTRKELIIKEEQEIKSLAEKLSKSYGTFFVNGDTICEYYKSDSKYGESISTVGSSMFGPGAFKITSKTTITDLADNRLTKNALRPGTRIGIIAKERSGYSTNREGKTFYVKHITVYEADYVDTITSWENYVKLSKWL